MSKHKKHEPETKPAVEELEDKTPVEARTHIVRNNKVPAKLGAQVLYVLSKSDSPTSAGRVRPGVIVDLVDDGSADGLVSLQVFTNGGIDQLPPVQHCKNIVHDEGEHPEGTWHWPPPRQLVFENVPMPFTEPVDPEPALEQTGESVVITDPKKLLGDEDHEGEPFSQ